MRRFWYIVTKPEAVEEINKFRRNWNIDHGGFKNKDKYYDWVTASIKFHPIKLKRITLYSQVIRYTIMKDKIHIGKPKKGSDLTEVGASDQMKFNEIFKKSVCELGRKIKIDNNWYDPFSKYLLHGNKVFRGGGERGLDIYKITELYEDGVPNRERLDIIIEPNTTREEVLSAWERLVEKEKKSMPGYIEVPKKWKFKGFYPPHLVKRNPLK